MKKTFKIIAIFSLSLFLALLQALSMLLLFSLAKVDANISGYDWNEDTTFSINEHTKTVQFSDEIDILFLTDLHHFGYFDEITSNNVRSIVTKAEPDFIILDGDNTFTTFNRRALNNLIKVMDSFSLPWTLVFGNHDDFGRYTKNYMARQLINSTYGIFTFGPNGFKGAGNQIINLESGGNIIHSLILLDTVRNGRVSPPITNKQIGWYEWAINGLEETNPLIFHTSLVTHVALPEMVTAIKEGVTLDGRQGENVSLMANNGLYDRIVDLGSTKFLFHGHDHYNNNITLYNEIYFTYVMQAGALTYGYNTKGGTLFKMNAEGQSSLELVII